MADDFDTPSTELILVGEVADLPPDARKVVQTRNGPLLVINVEGEVLAVSDICPHSSGYLHYGPVTDGVIECPLHFWPFDLRTGRLVGMPASYDEFISTYRVRQLDGQIFVEIPG